MNQQRNTIPYTTMSHMTTQPRLALVKNDAGELVPSMNLQGTQDMQVAGTVVTINPKPITYVRKDGITSEAYQGTADINVGGKEVKNAPVIFAASTIDNIEKGGEYWITARKSDDGTRTNLSCGALRVVTGLDASIADELSALLMEVPVAATA